MRKLYGYLRGAFPDFHAEIHWQLADGDRVTTFKTYRGTHEGEFLGIAPTHRKIQFETVDVMRVQNGRITDRWGVGNLLSLMQQIGGWTPPSGAAIARQQLKLCQDSHRTRETVLEKELFEAVSGLVVGRSVTPIVRTRLDGLTSETMKTAHERIETSRTIGNVVMRLRWVTYTVKKARLRFCSRNAEYSKGR